MAHVNEIEEPSKYPIFKRLPAVRKDRRRHRFRKMLAIPEYINSDSVFEYYVTKDGAPSPIQRFQYNIICKHSR